MQYTYSYTLLIHTPILRPIGDENSTALSLNSAMLISEYDMQYTYNCTLLIHILILKPIGDENSEHCLWFLLFSKSSMLCSIPIVTLYLYMHKHSNLLVMKPQSPVSGFCYARNRECYAVYLWLYFTYTCTHIKTYWRRKLRALSLVSTILKIEYAMQYTYSYTLLIHTPILRPIGDENSTALSLNSAMLISEYDMQYTYNCTLLIHILILKPIGDENSEHCLWFLLFSKSSMLCSIPIVTLYLYMHKNSNLLVMKPQSPVSGFCYARNRECYAVYLWLYFTYTCTHIKTYWRRKLRALSLVSTILKIEYAMQYSYSYTVLIHAQTFKPIGDETSEPCLWFLLRSKSSMLCSIPIVILYLYIYLYENLLVMKTQEHCLWFLLCS